MMMQPELIRDCFDAWRAGHGSYENSELVLIFTDRDAPEDRGEHPTLEHAAARAEALQPAGTLWNGPDGARYCVRSLRLEGRGVKLVRVRKIETQTEDYCAVGLSRRESEVFACLAEGLNHKEIGRKLFISSHTARKHIENIYTKLNVCNRVEALNKLRRRVWPMFENTTNGAASPASLAATK